MSRDFKIWLDINSENIITEASEAAAIGGGDDLQYFIKGGRN